MDLNWDKTCIVCGGEREILKQFTKPNGETITEYRPLIEHHVTYFPELKAHVHFNCHIEIHEGKHPALIQYAEGDSRKFYEMKKKGEIKN